MLHRSAILSLLSWHRPDKTIRKPLILRGARQVGKSTLIRQFAEAQKLDLAEINLERYPTLADVIATRDTKLIYRELEAITRKPLLTKSTQPLLFIDEIQAIPETIEMLRYLQEDAPELAIIAAGSLLEFALSEKKISMPVGRVEYLYLGPLTFEEFLSAQAEQLLLNYMQSFRFGSTATMIPQAAHAQLTERFIEFLQIGGMPEVLQTYISTKNLLEVQKMAASILDTYRDDFGKYCQGTVLERLRRVFAKLPIMLGEKLVWATLDREERADALRRCVELLARAQVITLAYHTAASGIPLAAQIDEKQSKPYFVDCGIASYAAGLRDVAPSVWRDPKFLLRGQLAVQFVAQHIQYTDRHFEHPELFYWQRESKNSNAEIDFVLQYRGTVLPIEVKAGTQGSMRSLHVFMAEKGLKRAVRFDLNQPSVQIVTVDVPLGSERKAQQVQYELISLPLYMVGQLRRLLGENV